MITAVVTYKHKGGPATKEQIAASQKAAESFRDIPGLIRKNFLYDPEKGQGGGAYTWPSVEAAQRGHDAAWRAKIREMYGSDPVIRYFETPVLVDNVVNDTIEAAA